MPKADKVHIKLFISYAHKDEHGFNVFKPLIKEELNNSDYFVFDAWEDSGIPAGTEWHDYIQKKLKKCRIAILCVSNHFFASEYIKESEFKNLLNSYNRVLIVPLYFGQCKIDTWNDLSAIQFFKPKGADYGMPEITDFSFSDLINSISLSLEDKEKNIRKYCEDLSQHLQQSYISANILEDPPKKVSDKIVTYTIIAAIVGALIFTFYSLVAGNDETRQFNSIMGSGVFFGSFAAFTYNKKSH